MTTTVLRDTEPLGDAETRTLLCELLRDFHARGWASGTGGGICGRTEDGNLFLAPTGVHKERVEPADLFVVSPDDGRVLVHPETPGLRPSECNAIFCLTVRERRAGSVAHSHALAAVLAADLVAPGADHLAISGLEMLKGIRGLSNRDAHRVPVIDNTARESELVSQVGVALADERFAGTFAILVRDHGAYIWGVDVWEAKRHAEVYHFLFEAVLARHRLSAKESR